MGEGLPLSALLSQTLIAFIIEFDNEFEHQVPHRTTNHGSTPGFPRAPWLVSMAMWVKYMQYIPDDGISFAALQQQLGMSTKALQIWVTRLGSWWGYLALPESGSNRIPPQTIIRPTAAGGKAIEVWRPLPGRIEARWRTRFGSASIDELKRALVNVVERLDPSVPDFFSILEERSPDRKRAAPQATRTEVTLPQLLAKVLIAFAGHFDQEAIAPIAACANVLRLTGAAGVRVRDLPRRSSLAKEGVAAALRMVVKSGCGVMQPDAATRSKLVLLTPKGRRARDAYEPLARKLEEDWQARFGDRAIRLLRMSLEPLLRNEGSEGARLMRGLAPYPNGWRAALPPLEGLPHFPMISHRGGFPDGS